MNDLNDHMLEQRLGRLVPRGAPRELRERILGSIAESHRPAPRRFRALLLDQAGTLATAALVFLAAIGWWVNLRLQEYRLAALLGPPPAERRIERLVESVEQVTNPEHVEAVRNVLIASLQQFGDRYENVGVVDSIAPNQTLLMEWLRDEMEEDRANPTEHRGDTTDDRRAHQLEVARTA